MNTKCKTIGIYSIFSKRIITEHLGNNTKLFIRKNI